LTSIDLASDHDGQDLTFATGYTGATTVSIAEAPTSDTDTTYTSTDKIVNTANVALTVTGNETNFIATTTVTGGTGVDTLVITADAADANVAGSGSATLTATTNINAITVLPNATTASTPASITLGADVSELSKTLTVDATGLTNIASTFTFNAVGYLANATNVIVNGATTATNTITSTGSSALTVTTGTGADTITSGSGNDVIVSGDGADSIIGAAGNDNISGGDGSDVFFVAAGDLTSDDTISGGAGTNTLKFSSAAAVDDDAFTNITGVQTVTSSGAGLNITLDALADAAGVVTVTMVNTHNDTVVVGADFDNALAISMGADTVSGSESVDASESSATISLTATAGTTDYANITSADTLLGGLGTSDKITVTASASNSTVTFGTSVSGWESVVVSAGSTSTSDISITTNSAFVANDEAATINASAFTDTGATLTFDGTAETGTGKYNVIGGAGNDTISGGSGDDTISGGAGADSIVAGTGADSVDGGDGDDTFYYATGDEFTVGNDVVIGGSGNDGISFAAAAVTLNSSDLLNISSVESLTFAATTQATSVSLTNAVYTANGLTSLTVNNFAATSGALTVSATNLSAANSVSVQVYGTSNSAGNDIQLGAGNDTVRLDTDTLDNAAQTISGGSGTDTLTLKTGGTAVIGSKVTGFETVGFTTAAAADNFVLTTNSATVASGATLTMSFGSLTGYLHVNGSAEANGYFNITSGTGADSLVGGDLADTLVAGAGDDTIQGGLGADVMTGGTGADTFFYAGAGFETGALSPVVVYYGGTIDAGTVISTSALDKILDFTTADNIDTNSPLTSGTSIAATSGVNGVGKAWTDPAGFLRGTYNATANTFTFSTTGSDSIFAYDNDGSTTTTDIRAIVLVGYVDSGADDVITTGLVGTA